MWYGGCKIRGPFVFFLRQFPLVSQPCTSIVSVNVPALLTFELAVTKCSAWLVNIWCHINALVILIPLSVLYRLVWGRFQLWITCWNGVLLRVVLTSLLYNYFQVSGNVCYHAFVSPCTFVVCIVIHSFINIRLHSVNIFFTALVITL